MCYNSTSPFLFLQTYYSLTIGYIQKRVTISSKKVDGFFKKGRPFWAKRSTFLQSCYLLCQLLQNPKKAPIESLLHLLDLLISW